MRPLLLLLLAGPALPGEFDDLFEPSEGERQGAFEAALKARGAGAALPAFRRCERVLAELREQAEKDHAAYRKLGAQWWGWRRDYEAAYERKHGRPPADYPIPPGLNSSFLASERTFRHSRAVLLKERLFHEWALGRVAEAVRAGDGSAAVARGLSDGSSAQRLRCARLADAEAAAAAAAGEGNPGVLAVLAAKAPSAALLADPAWNVRAGAIRGAARLGTREAALWLVARLDAEEGRLRDDLLDALRGMSGEDLGYDPARWRAWLEALPADWRAKRGGGGERFDLSGILDEPKAPGTCSAGPVSFFGIRSATRAAVYCVQASAGWEAVREELKRSVATLPEGAIFGVVAYDSEAHKFKSGLVEANATNRDALARWLDGLKPDRGVDTYAGLDLALELAARKAKVPLADTIFLAALTKPTEGALFEDPRQVMLEIVAENAPLGIRIQAFGPSDGSTSFYLQHLASQWSGSHVNG